MESRSLGLPLSEATLGWARDWRYTAGPKIRVSLPSSFEIFGPQHRLNPGNWSAGRPRQPPRNEIQFLRRPAVFSKERNQKRHTLDFMAQMHGMQQQHPHIQGDTCTLRFRRQE